MARTTAPIYRIGTQQADLLHIRDEDISVYQDSSFGEIGVQPQGRKTTPGISCWSTRQVATNAAAGMATRMGGRPFVWELPAGATYDDTLLRLWQPRPGKWYWSPARSMRGSVFLVALRIVNRQFQ
jgi:hypothetical protein